MNLSTNSLSKAWVLILLGFFFFSGLANAKEIKTEIPPSDDAKFRIAIFPVENISGGVAPLKQIRQVFIERLSKQGVMVLGEENLEKFMAKHRIRYVGGIDRNIAKAFKDEIGIEGVLIASLEFYSEVDPPKVALTSRLISTGENPSIVWADGIGLAGDDSPGILGLGLIEDPKALLEKAVKSLADSLTRYLLTRRDDGRGEGAKKKFQPKIFYRSPELGPDRKYVVAVLPFFNWSERQYAGEILMLHFIRQLKKFTNIEVIEFGVVRQELLSQRVIMEDGISLTNADAIFSVFDADLIVSGKVIDYQDYEGVGGRPKVNFSTVLLERKNRMIVWSSNSYNEGNDGVFFFDRGRVNTAHAMSSQMVRWIGEKILGDFKRVQGVKDSSGQVK